MSLADHDRRPGFDPRAPFRLLVDGMVAGAAFVQARLGSLIGAAAIIGFFAVILVIDWLRPAADWDNLAYLGVVARDWMGLSDPAAIHAFAFDAVRQATTPENWAALTSNDAYRERMASDPQAFVSMLGMYDVKWLYVALLAALFPWLGTDAGLAINGAAALLLAVSLIGWMQARGILRFGLAVPALLMIAGLPGSAMSDIPDFLALALMTSAVLAFDRDRLGVGTAALVLSVLTRPDALVAAGVLMAVAWYFRDKRLAPRLAIAFVLCLVAYAVIKAGSTHPGWWPHVWFSTYRIQNDMTGFDPDFSLAIYVTAFGWNLVRAAFENAWLGLYVMALGGWAMMHAAGWHLGTRRHGLVAAMLTAIAVKFALFPLHDGRVHDIFLVPALLLLMAEVFQRLTQERGLRFSGS